MRLLNRCLLLLSTSQPRKGLATPSKLCPSHFGNPRLVALFGILVSRELPGLCGQQTEGKVQQRWVPQEGYAPARLTLAAPPAN